MDPHRSDSEEALVKLRASLAELERVTGKYVARREQNICEREVLSTLQDCPPPQPTEPPIGANRKVGRLRSLWQQLWSWKEKKVG